MKSCEKKKKKKRKIASGNSALARVRQLRGLELKSDGNTPGKLRLFANEKPKGAGGSMEFALSPNCTRHPTDIRVGPRDVGPRWPRSCPPKTRQKLIRSGSDRSLSLSLFLFLSRPSFTEKQIFNQVKCNTRHETRPLSVHRCMSLDAPPVRSQFPASLGLFCPSLSLLPRSTRSQNVAPALSRALGEFQTFNYIRLYFLAALRYHLLKRT